MLQYKSTVTRAKHFDNAVELSQGWHHDARAAWSFLLEQREAMERSHGSLCPCRSASVSIQRCIDQRSRAGFVVGMNVNHHEDFQAYLSAVTYEVEFVPARPESGWLIFQAWPHALPQPAKVGNGRKQHGILAGGATGCGLSNARAIGDAVSHTAESIDCARCVKAIDAQNDWRRRVTYGASASFENESFGYGVAVDKATEWRADWYEREAISRAARFSLGLCKSLD